MGFGLPLGHNYDESAGKIHDVSSHDDADATDAIALPGEMSLGRVWKMQSKITEEVETLNTLYEGYSNASDQSERQTLKTKWKNHYSVLRSLVDSPSLAETDEPKSLPDIDDLIASVKSLVSETTKKKPDDQQPPASDLAGDL